MWISFVFLSLAHLSPLIVSPSHTRREEEKKKGGKRKQEQRKSLDVCVCVVLLNVEMKKETRDENRSSQTRILNEERGVVIGREMMMMVVMIETI